MSLHFCASVNRKTDLVGPILRPGSSTESILQPTSFSSRPNNPHSHVRRSYWRVHSCPSSTMLVNYGFKHGCLPQSTKSGINPQLNALNIVRPPGRNSDIQLRITENLRVSPRGNTRRSCWAALWLTTLFIIGRLCNARQRRSKARSLADIITHKHIGFQRPLPFV